MTWKRIPDFNYEINEFGAVRKLSTKRLIIPYIKKGYWIFRMSKDGRRKMYSVHRMVAMMFIPNLNPYAKKLVCHRDDNVNNNHVSNLYWGDKVDNQRDAERNGGWNKEMCCPKG